jgi:hypothetical protein
VYFINCNPQLKISDEYNHDPSILNYALYDILEALVLVVSTAFIIALV